MYGFVHYGSGNAEGDYFEFGHDGFQRGRPGLMHTIRQKENLGGTGTLLEGDDGGSTGRLRRVPTLVKSRGPEVA